MATEQAGAAAGPWRALNYMRTVCKVAEHYAAAHLPTDVTEGTPLREALDTLMAEMAAAGPFFAEAIPQKREVMLAAFRFFAEVAAIRATYGLDQ